VGFVDDEVETRAINQLRADPADGSWQRRHGHLLAQPTFDGSLRLLVNRRR
jgi:hypothetical protein